MRKSRKDMKKMGSMKNPHFGDGPTGSMSSEEVEMGEAVMGQDREMERLHQWKEIRKEQKEVVQHLRFLAKMILLLVRLMQIIKS